jgi:hypothetical protein
MANRILAAVLMLGMLMWSGSALNAAPPPPAKTVSEHFAFGSLSGKVTDARGTPQLGALVMVMAADGRVLHRVYTNEMGVFVQDHLIPGVYGLKVTLTSFLPAIKDHLTVQPGSKAFLSINLSSLSDTLAGLMGNVRPRPESDSDWKWVVRRAGALRPVLRFLPAAGTPANSPNIAPKDTAPYSDYRGRVEFAGGGSASSGFGGDAAMSTGFSVAQTLFADTTLLLGGNLGYERATPASAFRGVLHRDHGNDSTSEMSVTVRQIQLPGTYFARGLSRSDNFLATSSDFEETTRAGDWLRLVYGVSYDSVLFLGQINTINPHGRVIARLSPTATLQASYTQGPERQRREGTDPLRDVASQLTAFPQMSMRDGVARVERDRHAEIAYRQKIASQSVIEAVAYSDHISNFAIGVAGAEGVSGDLLPDVFSNTSSLNGGTRSIGGGRLAWEQGFGDHFRATASYSVAGLPAPGSRLLSSDNLNDLRDSLHNELRHAAALKLGWEVPGSKTRFVASYKWINGMAVLPRDLYSDSIGQIDSNFNVLIRQPLPQLSPFIGKVEALADFRNLLSQGYIPLVTADGKSIVLVQNARTFRGGLSFNF